MGFYELRDMETCFRNPIWKKINQDIYLLKDREGSWIIQQNFTSCGVQANSQIYFGTSPSKCLPTKSKNFKELVILQNCGSKKTKGSDPLDSTMYSAGADRKPIVRF